MTEFHQGRPDDFILRDDYKDTIDSFYVEACRYAMRYHEDSVTNYRYVTLGNITPYVFWREYIWTVYTSGFNARVVTTFFPRLIKAYDLYDKVESFKECWDRVRLVVANLLKCKSVHKTRTLLVELGWGAFQEKYLSSVDSLQMLPFVGPVTKHHLGRNLGFDSVKEDLHLVRLAKHFGFTSATEMCTVLSRSHQERVGVVDFILWSFSAAFGTKELE